MSKKIVFFIFSFFVLPAAKAQFMLMDTELYLQCGWAFTKSCDFKNPPTAIRIASDLCRTQMDLMACQELVKQDSTLQSSLKSCEPATLCKETLFEKMNMASGCFNGAWHATKDIIDFFTAGWDHAKASVERKNEFLRICDKSPGCKRVLIQNHPSYKDLTDEQLKKYSAAFLETERNNYSYMMNSVQIHNTKSKLLSELAEEGEKAASDKPIPAWEFPQDFGLWAAAKDWLIDKGVKLSCYNAEARMEMICYGAAQLVDPAAAVGILAKSPRLIKILGPKLKNAFTKTAERRIGSNVPYQSTLQREVIKEQLASAEYTTVDQNLAWISKAHSNSADLKFFEIENSRLKNLNDTLKDKELVTAMNNMHKQLVLDEVEALKSKYPQLIIRPYSDFKSLRFAIEGNIPADLQKEFEGAFSRAQDKFKKWAEQNQLVRTEDKVEDWFKMGSGTTADQASIAARYSRRSSQSHNDFASTDVGKALRDDLNKTETLRTELSENLKNTSLLQQTPKGDKVLSTEAFEILRKAESTADAQQKLKAKFGLSELSTETTQKMQEYMSYVDRFSPSLWIAQREVASLELAQNGGFSIDFIGLGARNLQSTAAALVNKKDVSEVLISTRQAEEAITRRILLQKAAATDVAESSITRQQIQTLCSGDDCVGITKRPLSAKDKQGLVDQLASAPEIGPVRIAFVAPKVPEKAARTQIATHGEAIEKLVRANLDSTMEPRRLRGLVFGVDMQTSQLGVGNVQLLTGSAPSLKLSPNEKIQIQKAFQQAIDTLNQDLQSRGAAGYRAKPDSR